MVADPKLRRLVLLYLALDVVCAGAGMGVPIFCILLGLPVGRRIVSALRLGARPLAGSLTALLRAAALTSAVTLVLMAALWSLALPWLFRPSADIARFGIPLLLFEPRASLIAWLALMVFISPGLQFLMTLLGGHLGLLRDARRVPGSARQGTPTGGPAV